MKGLPPLTSDQHLALSHLKAQTIAAAQNAAAQKGHSILPLTSAATKGDILVPMADALLRSRNELSAIYATFGKTIMADELIALIDAALKQAGVPI